MVMTVYFALLMPFYYILLWDGNRRGKASERLAFRSDYVAVAVAVLRRLLCHPILSCLEEE